MRLGANSGRSTLLEGRLLFCAPTVIATWIRPLMEEVAEPTPSESLVANAKLSSLRQLVVSKDERIQHT